MITKSLSKATIDTIFEKVHHPDVLSGGLWLNYGFGVGEHCEPWTVQYDEDDVQYGTELELQEV